MGNEAAKFQKGEAETAEKKVFFVSTVLDSILSEAKAELRKKYNICLIPYTQATTGPVLDIRDATNDDIDKLVEQSKSLERNRLLVALVPKTKAAESSERLVVLKKSLDYSKQPKAVNAILQFIRDTNAHYGNEEDAAELATGDIEPLPPERSHSTTPDGHNQVPVVFGQPNHEVLLQNAFQFLQHGIKEVKFQLVTPDSPSASSHSPSLDELSPLLVICKSDGTLKDDVRDAVAFTRSGDDVMLLVVTDKKDLKLDGVPAAKALGAMDRLYWNPSSKSYPDKENKKSLEWALCFLKRFQSGLNLKRTGNFRDSLKNIGKTSVSGSYYSVSSTRDGLEKSTVFFMKGCGVELTKTTQPSATTPLVLLTTSGSSAKEETSQILKNHKDPQGVLQVILQNPTHAPETGLDSSSQTAVTLLQADSGHAIQQDLQENKKAREQIRKRLVRLQAGCKSAQSTASRPDLSGSETGDTSFEEGNDSLASSVVSTDSHPQSQRRRSQKSP